ncbi:MAG: hypothetical protein IJW53_02460 [Clostridia bacterium]|nr:hypothetical protein [Clostridia bacterium]
MTLCEELYFEITLTGAKTDLKRFISYLKSGELDDFFEFTSDYISYDDEYEGADPEQETSVTLSNDDYGIEIDEFDTDEFLEVFCKAAKTLDVEGRLFDIDDEEYEFTSAKGDSYYLNAKRTIKFNDELDEKAYEEDMYED